MIPTFQLGGMGRGGGLSLEARVRSLFGAGARQGLMLHMGRRESLYQDSARTLLVNAAGDPIGSPSDLSGNGNHPFQTTATKRPLWQLDRAAPDGADDAWATPAIDFTGTDKITVVCKVRNTITSGAGMISELSSSATGNAGSFYLAGGTDVSITGYSSLSRGGAAAASNQAAKYSIAAPNTSVIVVTHDISGDLSSLEVNGVAGTPASGDKGTGNFGNYPLFFFARNGTSVYFKDALYAYFLIAGLLTAGETDIVKQWVNS